MQSLIKPQGGISTLSTAFLEILSYLNFLSLPVDKITPGQSCQISRESLCLAAANVCGWISVSKEQEVHVTRIRVLGIFLSACLSDSCGQATQQMIG